MVEELKQTFKQSLEKYITDETELKLINDALTFVEEQYIDKKHYDGSDYILHTLRSAIILTELHSDYICIASGLINWVPILCENVTINDIEKKFGLEVSNIVSSLNKINRIKFKPNSSISATYVRKILVGLSTDVRVIIIKLCGRLDNLRNVYTIQSEKQKEKCIETENILIPIAHRLGINYVKSELEDLCLKYLKPDSYNEIVDLLNGSKEELNKCIDDMKNSLSEIMIEHNIKYRIKGRVKSVHSLYEKLSKGKKWNQIYDILALRIITEKESDCYSIIGLIHAKYKPLPNRFKDYIAQPKENLYQSLHTGIIGPNGNIYEVQIRTEEMDEIAECGIASHWSYKEHGAKTIQNLMEQKLELFRDSLELNKNNSDEDALQKFNETFVQKMIYVFTPKGDVIELPEGSTPIDFAYRVHSHVGDTMVGAIVNNKIAPIISELKNDDVIKINTKEDSTPKQEWLNYVKTSQAKNKIKAFFSKQAREEYIKSGEVLLTKEIKRRNWNVNQTLTQENINKLVTILKLKDYDELKLSVGSFRYTANYVVSLLVNEKKNVQDTILKRMTSNRKDLKNYKNSVLVNGCDDILISIANCCKPVLGDPVVGYITKGSGIVVHHKNCNHIINEKNRIIDVSWNENFKMLYSTNLLIKTMETENRVLDIITFASQQNIPVEAINSVKEKNSLSYNLIIKVEDLTNLEAFIQKIKNLKFVKDVERDFD